MNYSRTIILFSASNTFSCLNEQEDEEKFCFVDLPTEKKKRIIKIISINKFRLKYHQ